MSNIEKLKALEARASAGPWVWNWSNEMSKYVDCRLMGKHGEIIPIRIDHYEPIWDIDTSEMGAADPAKEDREAIVAFRNSMKPLLAVAEAAAPLLAACEEEFTSPMTEEGDGRCGDDEPVAGGDNGMSPITFGHICKLRKALAALEEVKL